MPNKVALLTGTYSAYSGIDRVVDAQARQLISEGHLVTIMVLQATMEPPAGIRLIVLGLPGSSFKARVYRLFMGLDHAAIRRAADQLKDTDIVFSHQYPM